MLFTRQIHLSSNNTLIFSFGQHRHLKNNKAYFVSKRHSFQTEFTSEGILTKIHKIYAKNRRIRVLAFMALFVYLVMQTNSELRTQINIHGGADTKTVIIHIEDVANAATVIDISNNIRSIARRPQPPVRTIQTISSQKSPVILIHVAARANKFATNKIINCYSPSHLFCPFPQDGNARLPFCSLYSL